MRLNGKPLVQVFFMKVGRTDHVNWQAVVDQTFGADLELQRDGPSVVVPFTGGFAWVNPTSGSGLHQQWQGDGASSIDDFFFQLPPGMSAMAAAWNWFDDRRASWRDTGCDSGPVGNCHVIEADGGATWCNTWEANRRHEVSSVEIPTWDDYEEGSAVESGVDFNGGLPQPWTP